MKIFLISGAYSSKDSWNYFKHHLPENLEVYHTEYSAEDTLEHSKKQLIDFINVTNTNKDDIALIGYSLGGVLAFACAHELPEVKKIIAIASPFGGIMLSRWMSQVTFTLSAYNTFARQIPFMPSPMDEKITACKNFWDNVHPKNPMLCHLRKSPIPCESHVFIMESTGMNIWVEPSDGTVTVGSQTALGEKPGIIYFRIDGNHMDALLKPEVVSSVSAFLTQKQGKAYVPKRETKGFSAATDLGLIS